MNNELKINEIEPLNSPTVENPITIDNYPYGFKRTHARFWTETKKFKQRAMFQTQNPKTLVWNKPKNSTYTDIVVFYKDKITGHTTHTELNFGYDGIKELENFLKIFANVLTDYQKNQLKTFRAIINTRKHIKYTIGNGEINEEQKRKDEERKNKVYQIFLKYLGEENE